MVWLLSCSPCRAKIPGRSHVAAHEAFEIILGTLNDKEQIVR
ncbi:MAG: hypothetical protein Q7I97_05015 [Thermovirgaceae bacterium]|nr:hypothetical protein [Thermovirgaceae bacterium]